MDNIRVVDPVQLNGVSLKSSPGKTITVQVKHEDALIELHADNETAIQVLTDGGNSGNFSLMLDIWERGPADSPIDTVLLDPGQIATPGDISKAVPMMSLMPIGPGAPVSGDCALTTVAPANTTLSYDNVLTAVCDFTDIPVNTYEVIANVGGYYYTGGPDEDVFTVFDPSLGFTTGGGWFYWPGTDDKTNYGFNMKYNRTPPVAQGNLLMVRHLPDGSKYRVKSSSVEGLAVGDSSTFSWASFNGMATYEDPTMGGSADDYAFTAYIEDHAEPGKGADKFWIEVFDQAGDAVRDSSIEHSPQENAVTIEDGNTVVAHQRGKINRKER